MHERITADQLIRLIAAGTPLIFLATDNESRSESLVSRTLQRGLKTMPAPRIWSCTGGFAGRENTSAPLDGLRWALAQQERGVFIFKDFHWFWHDDPYLQRTLLDFAGQRQQPAKTLIFLGKTGTIPDVLQKYFMFYEHALPDRRELKAYLQARRDRDALLQKLLSTGEELNRLISAAQGLDLQNIESALRLGRLTKNANLAAVEENLFQAKKQLLQQSGIMEFVDVPRASAHVGGMENLKEWLAKREQVFGSDELTQGRNLPKGVLIMGISGCGKSLFVKAIAARWHLPMLRLDMATVYEGTYGSPESSLRQACRMAEALSPCVLWIDEIEAGISKQGFKSEGGAASRVLGYFLTWMQEKRHPVFVAATANAIELLPAEILRKGRFDEIFYVALPHVGEREEIFRIHLEKRQVDLASFSLSMLAHSAKGFSGAEIEQAVASAAFEALARKRAMNQQDVMESIGRTVPLSITMAEQIKKIEAWAFKRAVPASKNAAG
jgi:vesicle-fusing ATPase